MDRKFDYGIYTVIESESCAVKLIAFIYDNMYMYPTLTFYNVNEKGFKDNDSDIIITYDDSKYIIDEFYVNLVKIKNKNQFKDKNEILNLLNNSNITLEEILELFSIAINLNFFKNVQSELLK